jgi:hypothetical protein
MQARITLEAELLQVQNATRHALNNASAFDLRAQLAHTSEARTEAETARNYWRNEASTSAGRAAELSRSIAALANADRR